MVVDNMDAVFHHISHDSIIYFIFIGTVVEKT